jgi:hypothetical protein
MGTAKSSVSHTFNLNGHCGDYLARRRTLIRIARGLLGRDCNTRGHAINSRRDSFNFCRTHRRDRSVLWPERSWQIISPEILRSSQLRYSCWDFSAPHFAWKKAPTVIRVSLSPSLCLSLVQTPPGSLRSTASSKSRLELLSPWRLPLCDPSTNQSLQNRAPSNWAVVAGVSPAIPRFCSRHSESIRERAAAPTEDLLANADNAWIAKAV